MGPIKKAIKMIILGLGGKQISILELHLNQNKSKLYKILWIIEINKYNQLKQKIIIYLQALTLINIKLEID